ncbi:MAG: hypothetical protein ACE5OZ_04395 [Candidatus Heimdallarchaeota archaeon]
MYFEMLEAFRYGLNYATILCAEAALNSYLTQKLAAKPRVKKSARKIPEEERESKHYEMPSTVEMIRKAEFIDRKLQEELIEFITIRNRIEHPKSQLELSQLNWKHEKGSLYSIEPENFPLDEVFSKLFQPNIMEFAQRGILLYFQVCQSFLNHLRRQKKRG